MTRPESPSDTLRRAAGKVRVLAGKATPGPYTHDRYEHGGSRFCVIEPDVSPLRSGRRQLIADFYERGDREWHTSWTPVVAEPLAAWLDQCADYCEAGQYAPTALTHDRPLALARALLGSPVPEPDGEGTT